MIPPEDSLSLVYFVSFEGFAVASSMEGSALIFIIPTFSAVDLPFALFLKRKRGEFLILLIWVVLVDTHLYPAVHRCPDAKTDLDGNTCLTWLKQYTHFLASKDRFLL